MAAPSMRDDVGLQRIADIGADLAGGALGGLERDVAGKAFGDDDVHGALADIVALDEAVIDEAFADGLVRGCAPASRTSLVALHFLGADIEQADGRRFLVEQRARQRRAEDREIDRAAWRRRRSWRPRRAR